MKRLIINLLLSLLIGAFFIWLAGRGVDWAKVGDVFARIDPTRLLLYFLILSAIQLVRILRWGILLKPLGPVSLSKLLSVGSVGIMALMLLPLRLGEFARPMLISEHGRIPTSAALATVVVERVVDSLCMAGLLVLILFFLGGRMVVPVEIRSWAYVLLLGFVSLLGFLVIAYHWRDQTVRWISSWFLRPLPEKVSQKITELLRQFIDGLKVLPDARLITSFLLSTILYWGMAGWGMWFMFCAFDGLCFLGWVEALTVLSLLCVGLMIPAGPGMIGNFHYFVKLGLALFVSESILGAEGVAYAIVVHAMQLLQQIVWGVPFLFSRHITLKRFFSKPTVPSPAK